MTTNTPAPAQRALLTDDEMIACFKDAIQRARAQGLADAGPHEYVAAGAVALLSKLRAPVADERAAFDDETAESLLRAIDMLAPISEGKAQTSADGLFSKTRERAATITDARRVLSFALPMLRSVHAALASAPVAGEAQKPVLCVSSADFKRLREADAHIKAWLPPLNEALDMALYAAPQASEAVTLTGINADRLRAIASSGSLTAMSNALLNVARRLGSQDSKAVCNASNAFDDWLATHCDSDDLEAYEVKLARDAWCAALSAQPGAQKEQSDA